MTHYHHPGSATRYNALEDDSCALQNIVVGDGKFIIFKGCG